MLLGHLCLLAACATGPAPRARQADPAPAPAATCEGHMSRQDAAAARALLHDAVVACAAEHLRTGYRIEGEVQLQVQVREGRASAFEVRVTPAERREALSQCVRDAELSFGDVVQGGCALAHVELTFESQVQAPVQAQPSARLGDPGAAPITVTVGPPEASLALTVEVRGTSEARALRALGPSGHRAVEVCYRRAAEAALEESSPFALETALVVRVMILGGVMRSSDVETAPASGLGECVAGVLGRSGWPVTPEPATLRYTFPTRRYLAEETRAALRR